MRPLSFTAALGAFALGVGIVACHSTIAQTTKVSAPTTVPTTLPAAPTGEAEVAIGIGRLAYYDGRFTEAEAKFREAIAAEPNAAQGHYYLGLTLLAQNSDAEALVELETALGIDASLHEARAGRASALIKLKR